MKKLALIIGLMIPALNSIAAKDYPPMVVEGRTWHYDAPVAALCQQAFRFRIGPAENIDGETWYPVLQIWTFRATESESHVDEDVKTVCHIRQEGNTVYTRLSSNYLSYKSPLYEQYLGVAQHLYKCMNTCEGANHDEEEVAILSFKLYGDYGEEFTYTSDVDCENKSYMNLRFGNSTQIENSGRRYQQFELSIEDYHYEYFHPGIEPVYCVPEFGYTAGGLDPYNYGYHSELFFAPLGCYFFCTTPYQTNPVLEYVTDENDNVIFEYRVYKPSGMEDSIVESEDLDCTWYTVDGLVIDAPTAPGIYIRRSGSRTEKVAIR